MNDNMKNNTIKILENIASNNNANIRERLCEIAQELNEEGKRYCDDAVCESCPFHSKWGMNKLISILKL